MAMEPPIEIDWAFTKGKESTSIRSNKQQKSSTTAGVTKNHLKSSNYERSPLTRHDSSISKEKLAKLLGCISHDFAAGRQIEVVLQAPNEPSKASVVDELDDLQPEESKAAQKDVESFELPNFFKSKLSTYCLHPSDLTSEELEDFRAHGTTWLLKNVKRIKHREIQARLDAHKFLNDNGIPPQSLVEIEMHLFETMDTAERSLFVSDYKRLQDRAISFECGTPKVSQDLEKFSHEPATYELSSRKPCHEEADDMGEDGNVRGPGEDGVEGSPRHMMAYLNDYEKAMTGKILADVQKIVWNGKLSRYTMNELFDVLIAIIAENAGPDVDANVKEAVFLDYCDKFLGLDTSVNSDKTDNTPPSQLIGSSVTPNDGPTEDFNFFEQRRSINFTPVQIEYCIVNDCKKSPGDSQPCNLECNGNRTSCQSEERADNNGPGTSSTKSIRFETIQDLDSQCPGRVGENEKDEKIVIFDIDQENGKWVRRRRSFVASFAQRQGSVRKSLHRVREKLSGTLRH